MKEYIERAAALSAVRRAFDDEECDCEVMPVVFKALQEVEAADVVEVRHGIWVPSESDFDDDDTLFDVEDWCDWQCSVCREDICYEDPMERRFLPKFCPNCGAKMDGGAHETD